MYILCVFWVCRVPAARLRTCLTCMHVCALYAEKASELASDSEREGTFDVHACFIDRQAHTYIESIYSRGGHMHSWRAKSKCMHAFWIRKQACIYLSLSLARAHARMRLSLAHACVCDVHAFLCKFCKWPRHGPPLARLARLVVGCHKISWKIKNKMTSPSDPPLRPSPAWLWGVTSKDATVNSGGKVQTTDTQLLRCQYLYFVRVKQVLY